MTKSVKAKGKVSKIKVKSVKLGKIEANGGPEKVSLNESKSAQSVYPVFMYPNKGKGELDHVRVSLNGKDHDFTALSEAKLDISGLKLHDLLKKLFIELAPAKVSGVRLVYRNVYGFAFGYGVIRPTSYKCAIAHHNGDGSTALIFNQCGSFTLAQIDDALTKQGIVKHDFATYRTVMVSESNLPKVVKAIKSLLAIA